MAVDSSATRPRAFHVMTKPIGPICNLDCKYCFYLEKENLYAGGEKWRMSDEVLEAYVRQYIEAQDVPEVNFAWQGGEPTLLGVDFFRKAVALQKQYANGKRISNALQTNGTLLDDDWGRFLAENEFLVGLSIDGPRELHDAYRVDKKGQGTFDAVIRGLSFLQKHRAEYNTLTVVNRLNSQRPLEVYRFLQGIGSRFLQFIPLVERKAGSSIPGLSLAAPPIPGLPADDGAPVTQWSVRPEDYGQFLCAIFDTWVRRDVGRTYVQLFDCALSCWMGCGASLCVFAETCGAAMALEHNGDLYSCDHYVYPRYRLGNLLNRSLGEMAASPDQRRFGNDKFDTLPRYCRNCEWRFACNGECPKHRFVNTPDGEPGLNYLCPAYKRFFAHVDPYMRQMCEYLHRQEAPARIMEQFRPKPPEAPPTAAPMHKTGRNDPCPCGSGKKYKKCCGAAHV